MTDLSSFEGCNGVCPLKFFFFFFANFFSSIAEWILTLTLSYTILTDSFIFGYLPMQVPELNSSLIRCKESIKDY